MPEGTAYMSQKECDSISVYFVGDSCHEGGVAFNVPLSKECGEDGGREAQLGQAH